MKRKLIEYEQDTLIMCDNKTCDYRIPYPKEGDTSTEKYINMPCPKCGENLLTLEDYTQHKKVMKMINWVNKYFSWTCYFVSKKKWDARKSYNVHVHNGINIKDNE